VVSLVPSQTELLVELDAPLVGITRFCVRPPHLKNHLTVIGGTKNASSQRILALEPDVVIANVEENERYLVEELEQHVPVWVTDIKTLADNERMISQLGQLLEREGKANSLLDQMRSVYAAWDAQWQVESRIGTRRKLSAVYMIWRDPWMVAGGDTFIHHMLQRAGFENAFGQYSRYPECSLEDLREMAPSLILLSSEPFPFKTNHCEEIHQLLPKAQVLLVDGEAFSWYGVRPIHAPIEFERIYRELLPT
jgi:ABC-type Fe3+-hydroxamate transport system substrate-binding protein